MLPVIALVAPTASLGRSFPINCSRTRYRASLPVAPMVNLIGATGAAVFLADAFFAADLEACAPASCAATVAKVAMPSRARARVVERPNVMDQSLRRGWVADPALLRQCRIHAS